MNHRGEDEGVWKIEGVCGGISIPARVALTCTPFQFSQFRDGFVTLQVGFREIIRDQVQEEGVLPGYSY